MAIQIRKCETTDICEQCNEGSPEVRVILSTYNREDGRHTIYVHPSCLLKLLAKVI